MEGHKIILIACINHVNALGRDNKLLYRITNDLENFKRQTVGNVVIMGKNTFLSLPKSKPLPDRENIIITSDEGFSIEPCDNAVIVHSIAEAIAVCYAYFPEKEWFIIGGASVYNKCLEKGLIDEMRLTRVLDDTEGDVYLDEFDTDKWRLYFQTAPITHLCKDSGDTIAFRYETWRKKN